MLYILSPIIKEDFLGMWAEGNAYERRNIYSIDNEKHPPVNYDEHVLRVHSLTHLETSAHTQIDGDQLGVYYKNVKYFYGITIVLRLSGNNYKKLDENTYHWVVTKQELISHLNKFDLGPNLEKVLITTDIYYKNKDGFHDPKYVLTLSLEAAEYLCTFTKFNLFGASWKSSDYSPSKRERLVHNILFEKAVILENLDLSNVPSGIYFLSAFPIPIVSASEAPVIPILFTQDELETVSQSFASGVVKFPKK